MKKSKIKQGFYSITIILTFVTIGFLFYKYSEEERITFNPSVSYISSVTYKPQLEFFPIDPVKDSINKLKVEQKQKIEAQERQARIDKIEALFKRYNAPMQTYGELVYKRAEECGGDYRVLVGIAGNESAFGRVPYKLYNPYGYLDGKQYADWNDSLTFLSCVISQRFLAPCNNDLRCIINKYAGPSDDKEQWIRNVTYFINQL